MIAKELLPISVCRNTFTLLSNLILIDYLECDGKLEIHPSCKIGKINGNIKTESHNISIQNDNKEINDNEILLDKIIESKNADKANPIVKEIITKYQDGKLNLNEVELMLDALSSS
jgi:type VI protein secretion system component Hcp